MKSAASTSDSFLVKHNLKYGYLCLYLLICSFFLNKANCQYELQFKNVGDKIKDMPQLPIWDAFINEDGVLWFTNSLGLHSFNGHSLTHYSLNADNLSSITNIYEYNKDSILVGGKGEPYLFSKATFKKLGFSGSVNKFYKSNKNLLFLATAKGLYQYDNNQYSLVPGSPSENISDIKQNKAGVIYFYAESGIYRLQNGKIEIVIKTAAAAGKIAFDTNDYLYYTDTSLHIFKDGSSKEIVKFKSLINNIFSDNKNQIYFCDGFYIYKVTDKYEIVKIAHLHNDSIISAFFDKDNQLWLLGSGYTFVETVPIAKSWVPQKSIYLTYIKKKSKNDFEYIYYNISTKGSASEIIVKNNKRNVLFKTVDKLKQDSLFWTDFQTWGWYLLSEHEIYRSVGKYGYMYINGSKLTHVKFPTKQFCRSIVQSAVTGQIWIQSYGGLINAVKEKYFLYENPKLNKPFINLNAIQPDPEKNWIWVGYSNGSVGYFDVDSKKYVLLDSLIKINTVGKRFPISDFLFDAHHNIWVFSGGNGIYIINRNDVIKNSFSAKLWTPLEFSDQRFKFDSRGNLWCVDNNVIKVYKSGKSGIPEDPALFRIIDPVKEIEGVTTYLNYLRFPNVVSQDTMLIYSEFSVFEFPLNNIFPDFSVKNPVAITAVYLNRESINWRADKYSLNILGLPVLPRFEYFENKLGFEFGTLNEVKNPVVYRYKLNEADKNWYVINSNSVYFENLSPGNYSFLLEFSYDGNKWSSPTIYSFIIEQPWWNTVWSRIFTALILISAIAFIIKLRIKNLKRQNKKLEILVEERTLVLRNTNEQLALSNKQNEMLISVMAHDVKSPLRFLSDVSENLYTNWDNIADDKRKLYGLEIKKSSKILFVFMNDFLSWIKLRNGESTITVQRVDIHSLLNRIANYHNESGNCGSNVITVLADNNISVMSNQKYLEIIINNLVDNSCKYTKNGMIILSACTNETSVIISCKDSGRGMSDKMISQLLMGKSTDEVDELNSYKLGYRFICDLSKKIGAKIEIESKITHGTEVKVYLTNGENLQYESIK